MCGIYGWQLRDPELLSPVQRAIASLTMAEEMETRGRDSYGAAIWTPQTVEGPEIIKHLGKITESGSEIFQLSSEANQVLAHTRAATTGKVIEENSHPFLIGDVLGVHNGMIYNHYTLLKEYGRDFDVDSMHIFAHINENKRIEELDGYGAIVFTRASEGHSRIYLARSVSGSMEVCRLYRKTSDENGNQVGVMFSSTSSALRKAVERLGYHGRGIQIEAGTVYMIEEGQIFATDQKFPLSMLTNKNSHFQQKEESNPYRNMHRHHGMADAGDDSPVTITPAGVRVDDDYDDVPNLVYMPPKSDYLRSDNRFPKMSRGDSPSERVCTSCFDPLREHLWGICTGLECMQRAVDDPLFDDICKLNLPICDRCGCYLVNTVHEKAIVPDESGGGSETVLWCDTHNCFCEETESRKSRKDRRDIRKKVRETIVGLTRPNRKCSVCRNTTLAIIESLRTGICEACRKAKPKQISGGDISTEATDGNTPSGKTWKCSGCNNYFDESLLGEVSKTTGKCTICRHNMRTRDEKEKTESAL